MFNWFKKDKNKNEEYNHTLESQNTDGDFEAEDEIESLEAVDEAADPIASVEENDIDIDSGGLLERLKKGLSKTRKDMSNKIEDIISGYKGVDDELFNDLEDVLVSADVGVNPTMMIIDRLRERVREERVSDPKEVKGLLKDEIKKLMLESVPNNELDLMPHPSVLLVVGVNGVGKTTTIGKLAYGFKENGKKVLIAAGDTFRAAAIEQLEEWSNRAGAEIISHTEGSDPAAVIFDGIQAAKARKADILICDTAGRLHNKSNLMNELNKIFRIVEREYGEATKEVLLVLDATTGQNAINQAKVFKEVANITGVALTKLDGTAKGGVAIALQTELKLPIKIIGVGEKVEDLQPFDTDSFIDAIFE
ncbi:MAG: signal recognition particle-docking protein FtsY [Gudongella sp.]|nr:signal recognition particle-docking protein FtsY [Gudongella sp.]